MALLIFGNSVQTYNGSPFPELNTANSRPWSLASTAAGTGSQSYSTVTTGLSSVILSPEASVYPYAYQTGVNGVLTHLTYTPTGSISGATVTVEVRVGTFAYMGSYSAAGAKLAADTNSLVASNSISVSAYEEVGDVVDTANKLITSANASQEDVADIAKDFAAEASEFNSMGYGVLAKDAQAFANIASAWDNPQYWMGTGGSLQQVSASEMVFGINLFTSNGQDATWHVNGSQGGVTVSGYTATSSSTSAGKNTYSIVAAANEGELDTVSEAISGTTAGMMGSLYTGSVQGNLSVAAVANGSGLLLSWQGGSESASASGLTLFNNGVSSTGIGADVSSASLTGGNVVIVYDAPPPASNPQYVMQGLSVAIETTSGKVLTSGSVFPQSASEGGYYAHVASTQSGGYAIAWDNYTASGSFKAGNYSLSKNVALRIYNSAGGAVTSQINLSSIGNGDGGIGGLAGLSNGNIAVAFNSSYSDNGSAAANTLEIEVLNSSGAVVKVDTINGAGTGADSVSTIPVASLANGNFVAAWNDIAGAKYSAQIFNSSGGAISGVISLDSSYLYNYGGAAYNFALSPSVTALSNGDFVVQLGDGLQLFSATGQALSSAVRIASVGHTAGDINVTALANAKFAVSWVDDVITINAQGVAMATPDGIDYVVYNAAGNGSQPVNVRQAPPNGPQLPTIGGTIANQSTTSEAPYQPFLNAEVDDPNNSATATDTLNITMNGGGGTLSGTGLTQNADGTYTLQGTGYAITSALAGLTFTPNAGAPNTSTTTTFTLSDTSSAYAGTVTDSTTSVTDIDPSATPKISGTLAGQQTRDGGAISPFGAFTLTDLDGGTDTLTINVSGGGGTLSGPGLTLVSGQVASQFVTAADPSSSTYILQGDAVDITAAMRALVFAPTVGAAGTTSTTSFTLTAISSDAATFVTDSVTSVVDSELSAAPTLAAASDTGASSNDGITRDTTPTVMGTVDPGVKVTLYDGTKVVGSATANKTTGAYTITSSVLAAGTHLLTIETTDASGKVSSASAATTIDVDTHAPATPATPTLAPTSDSGISSADGITNVTTPTFTGTAEIGSTVTLYDGTRVVGTGVAQSNGTYAITAGKLTDGAHQMHVTATDVAGNVSATSGVRSIVIDTTPDAAPAAPTLTTDTGRSSIDGITSEATPTFTGKVAAAGETVTLYDGSTVVGSVVAGAKGVYSVTATTLTDGVHAIKVTSTDAAGNVSAASAARSVTIDTTAPAVPAAPTLAAASDTGSSASDGITSDATPTFTGLAESNATVTLYDGAKVVGTALAGANGNYSVTASTLANGQHALSVTATDAAGNVSARSAATSVQIDTVAPAAPNISLAHDTGISAADRITNDPTLVYAAAEPGDALQYSINGKTWSDTAPTFAADGSADGVHTVYARSIDVAGNVGAAGGLRFTLDTTAPAVSISNEGGDVGSARQTITGRTTARTAVTLTENGNVIGTTTSSRRGIWSETVNLASGSNSLVASVSDVAGNVGSASIDLHYTPATAASAASLHSMVQAMSTMTPQSSAAMSPSPSAQAQEHTLAAGHG